MIVTDPTYVGMVSRVRMAGATPVFVPFRRRDRAWRLDLDALEAAAGDRTRALFVMNPSMPSGAVLDAAEWDAIAGCAGGALLADLQRRRWSRSSSTGAP